MLSYRQTAAPAALWPEPMELIWQMQPPGWAPVSRWKRRDITLSDRAFIAAVVNIPRDQRPWGAITWLGNVYRTSRQTLYTIGAQVREALLFPSRRTELQGVQMLLPTPPLSEGPTITVTDNRRERFWKRLTTALWAMSSWLGMRPTLTVWPSSSAWSRAPMCSWQGK